MRAKNHRLPILRPVLVCVTATATLLLGSVVTAQHSIDGVNGDAAIRALGNRLADVADRHGMTPAGLAALLQSDDTLWLDENDRLVYVDTAIPEVEHQPVSVPIALFGISLEDAFRLETDPGADRTIYLDFDGHHSVNNGWGHNITFPSYNVEGDANSFTNGELAEIISIWQHVAEDFAPFGVNVTTMDPGVAALTKINGGDQTYGCRCIMTQSTNGFGSGIGGVAHLNSFDSSLDEPVFAFNKGPNNGSMTASHEMGHALGLFHDGLFGQSYHPGQGAGPTSWGPIMGAPFGKNLVQWSKGQYDGATNLQDDLLFIGAYVPDRPDIHADNLASATEFTECSSTLAGIIGEPTDVDVFTFTTNAGNVTMDAFPTSPGPNLDIQMTLFDGAGVEMFALNLPIDIWAAITFPLAAGQYYLEIDGVGLSGEYTHYGSLGHYTLTVEVPGCGCVADLTGDGMVGIQDFLELLAAWGPCAECAADLNNDGMVGIQDFLDLLAAWGACP